MRTESTSKRLSLLDCPTSGDSPGRSTRVHTSITCNASLTPLHVVHSCLHPQFNDLFRYKLFMICSAQQFWFWRSFGVARENILVTRLVTMRNGSFSAEKVGQQTERTAKHINERSLLCVTDCIITILYHVFHFTGVCL